MAIVRRRGAIQSQKFAKKQRKKIIFGAVIFFIVLVSIFTTIFFFFRAQFVQIKSVTVSGPIGINGGVLSIVPADAVQTDIENNLTGGWLLGLISKNTLFSYPEDSIREQLMQEYPTIDSINFDPTNSFLDFGNNIGLHVFITERSPTALACSEGFSAGSTLTAPTCFYMDNEGFVYAPAAQFSPGVYIDYVITPQSGLPAVTVGKPIVSQASFDTAKKIVGSLSGMGLKVTTDIIGVDPWGSTDTLIINNGSGVMNVTNLSASSSIIATSTNITMIYFNQNESLDTELSYFSEFWKQEVAGTSTAYQYIDMRYGKDIVYKAYSTGSDKASVASTSKK